MINIDLKDIKSYLKTTDFFAAVNDQALEKLASRFKSVYIKSGEVVIKQGDQGDCLYLVISGHLRAIKESPSSETILGEIKRGELIGELALLTHAPRAVTIVTIRDSFLLKLSKEDFDQFIIEHPTTVMSIVKPAITRILDPKKPSSNTTALITLAPAGKHCSKFGEFTYRFVETLSLHAEVLHLNSTSLKDHLKKSGIHQDQLKLDDIRVIQWLNDQEDYYPYIVYETDQTVSEWTDFCLRQSDKIILVGCSDQSESLNPLEEQLYKLSPTIRKTLELALIHPDHISLPSLTTKWLEERPVFIHHHIKFSSPETIERLARYSTGKSISLVCGGGGARGISYIGVYKALRELKIPIDMLGGTSAGAMLPAFFGYEQTPEEIVELIKNTLLKNKRAFSYTMPIISLISGIEWAVELKNCYGADVDVEDLWRNFFCITTNMSQNKMNILRTGKLWKAIRASISLPAVVPPISNEKNELLVDGGVVNNLPIDIMRTINNGGKIIAARLPIESTVTAEIPEGAISGWDLFAKRLNPFKKNTLKMPSLPEIVINTIMVSSQLHESLVLAQADYQLNLDLSKYTILNCKPIDELVEIGYQQTMRHFEKSQFKF